MSFYNNFENNTKNNIKLYNKHGNFNMVFAKLICILIKYIELLKLKTISFYKKLYNYKKLNEKSFKLNKSNLEFKICIIPVSQCLFCNMKVEKGIMM